MNLPHIHWFVRLGAVVMFGLWGSKSFYQFTVIATHAPEEVSAGLRALLFTAVMWGTAAAIAFGRKKKPPCVAV